MRNDVAVVFVNYRSRDMIEPRAVRLLAKGVPVLVADNSGDFDAQHVPSLSTGGNVGFGAACNLAVAALPSTVRTVCLHNPDVDIEPDAVLALAELVTPGRGAIAPAISTGRVVREHGFHYPTPQREAYLACRSIRAGRGGESAGSGIATRRVRGHGRRFGTAALLLVARDAFAAVGGFDERYFLYAEDLDLWHRLQCAGYANAFEPAVVAAHAGAAGSAMDRSTRTLLRWLGVELFAETHLTRGWRGFRAVHRAFLGRIAALPRLHSMVNHAWADGAPPSVVALAAREVFSNTLIAQ
jgi:N-acetylglucosaminyl-diphospho-decaprenol L-rhamnosyltransferase